MVYDEVFQCGREKIFPFPMKSCCPEREAGCRTERNGDNGASRSQAPSLTKTFVLSNIQAESHEVMLPKLEKIGKEPP
jgi:hypothetical protein